MEKSKILNQKFDCMTVTAVWIKAFEIKTDLGKVVGKATILLNDQFEVHDIQIVEGDDGLFVAFPLDTSYDGPGFRWVCSPVSIQLNEHIKECVLNEYLKTIA